MKTNEIIDMAKVDGSRRFKVGETYISHYDARVIADYINKDKPKSPNRSFDNLTYGEFVDIIKVAKERYPKLFNPNSKRFELQQRQVEAIEKVLKEIQEQRAKEITGVDYGLDDEGNTVVTMVKGDGTKLEPVTVQKPQLREEDALDAFLNMSFNGVPMRGILKYAVDTMTNEDLLKYIK